MLPSLSRIYWKDVIVSYTRIRNLTWTPERDFVYADLQSVEKGKSNDEIVAYAMPIVQLFEKHRKEYAVHVMDSMFVRTSTAFLLAGLNPRRLHVFSCDEDDANSAAKYLPGVDVRCIFAEQYYMDPMFCGGAHIVIDDGMQTGRKTLPRILALIAQRARFLAIFCNLAGRNDTLKSNANFVSDVTSVAESFGYRVTSRPMSAYKGKEMCPLWMELILS
jgi:hypothetical protein